MERRYQELAEAFFRQAEDMIARLVHSVATPEWAEEAMEFVDNVATFLGEHGIVSKYDWDRLSQQIDEAATKRFGVNWYLQSLRARVDRAQRPRR